ncbi:hypothetical protein CHUAL_006228 [Chamberlinius hualienensis]
MILRFTLLLLLIFDNNCLAKKSKVKLRQTKKTTTCPTEKTTTTCPTEKTTTTCYEEPTTTTPLPLHETTWLKPEPSLDEVWMKQGLNGKELIDERNKWAMRNSLTQQATVAIYNCFNKCGVDTLEKFHECLLRILSTTCNLRIVFESSLAPNITTS